MKFLRLLVFALAGLIAVPAFAQDKPADNMQILLQKIHEDKKLLVAENLQLTDAEAKAFWPVYGRYQDELFLLRTRTAILIKDYAQAYEQLSGETAKKLLDEYMTIEALGLKLRQAYPPKFRGVLPEVKVLRLIGEGGTSRVYLAAREGDDEPLVVKILRSEVTNDKKALERFVEEYNLVSRIRTRHVARIHSHGIADGCAYLVMEFFDGGDLNKRLDNKALPPDECLQIFRELMFALGDIHEQGILHRDLKPQNLMFRSDGSLAVLDFGIAKHVDGIDRTSQGEILGTPRYMSPEQVRGSTLDLRTDIYSAGVLLYRRASDGIEVLLGHRPLGIRGRVRERERAEVRLAATPVLVERAPIRREHPLRETSRSRSALDRERRLFSGLARTRTGSRARAASALRGVATGRGDDSSGRPA